MSKFSQLGRAQIMQMTFFLEISGFVRILPGKMMPIVLMVFSRYLICSWRLRVVQIPSGIHQSSCTLDFLGNQAFERVETRRDFLSRKN